MKIPVYKALLETKTTMGLPLFAFVVMLAIAMITYIIIKSLLVFLPIGILFVFIKIISKNDPKYLELYFQNLKNPYHIGQ